MNLKHEAIDAILRHRQAARSNFVDFALDMYPNTELTRFHETYYKVLDLFAHGEIKRLIVTVPPQHGKSTASTQLLPAYILGLNPDKRIAIASYAHSLASKFNRRVQRIIDSGGYARLFPDTRLATASDARKGKYTKTAGGFDVVDAEGSLISVGRGGGLTGNRVDCFIMDDLYKDAQEGNSPIVRDGCLEWYNSVVKTRLHNDSQELIVFTRWHEDDLIGTLEQAGEVIEVSKWTTFNPSYNGFYKVNFEAIKDGEPTQLDPRSKGDVLWETNHNITALEKKRQFSPHTFECMYQGHPSSKDGYLYGDNIKTYQSIEGKVTAVANYTDTADMGDDYLCSVCYTVADNNAYVTDILYTQDPMELTERATAQMLERNNTRRAMIESNNGGRGFARAVQKLAPSTKIEWFTQRGNKESRILTNAATVLHKIHMPEDWRYRWPEFHRHVTTYKRVFSSNKHDDAADVLSGIAEEMQRAKLTLDKRTASLKRLLEEQGYNDD
ncbi:MAG: phage terminase large subunit [Rikenellaceae bacterium]